jgi:hypothetical protein
MNEKEFNRLCLMVQILSVLAVFFSLMKEKTDTKTLDKINQLST